MGFESYKCKSCGKMTDIVSIGVVDKTHICLFCGQMADICILPNLSFATGIAKQVEPELTMEDIEELITGLKSFRKRRRKNVLAREYYANKKKKKEVPSCVLQP